GSGGTLSLDNAGGLVLKNNGTNAAVTRRTCGITGAAAGSLAGVYFDGVPYTTGNVIDVSSTTSGTGYTYSSPVFTINANGEYLIWNATTANRIVVASGVEADIILFGASIQPVSGCAFDMTGATVDMTLMGNSKVISGKGYTCVLCPLGSTLTISGSGSLNATARNNSSGAAGSGIGGNTSAACGSITIKSGTVTAAGGNPRIGSFGLAGIGGAVVNISGGTVNAFSHKGGAAIGYYSNPGSSITITGGTVTATAGINNYGIGGKASGAPDITISGGTVTASGDLQSPAIGGTGGTLTISGGTVYTSNRNSGPAIAVYKGETVISGGTVYAASSDPANFKDIGTATGFEGTLTISGTARVFLKNNLCDTPITTTHENETFAAGTAEVYGEALSVPDDWTGGFGAYLRPCTLSYHGNGGSGTAPEMTRLYGAAVTVPDSSGLTKSGYVFDCWNTAANGRGTDYAAGSSFTLNTDATLYAQWTKLELASTAPGGSTSSATVYTGGRFTLTPSVGGGVWDWDEEYFSATFNSPATFTALKEGNSDITYTVGVQITIYVVTIKKSGLPNTGQDFTWIYVFFGLGILVVTGAALFRKRVIKQGKTE
ncbi:MAG: InlB B-repeat-containing protein, partial [Bacillota bacterium]